MGFGKAKWEESFSKTLNQGPDPGWLLNNFINVTIIKSGWMPMK